MVKFLRFIMFLHIFNIVAKDAQYYNGFNFDLCDRQYVAQMKVVLSELSTAVHSQPRSALRVDLAEVAKRYMILLKRYQELQYKILSFEDKSFNPDTIAILIRPYSIYSECKMFALNFHTGLATNVFTDPDLINKIGYFITTGQPIPAFKRCEKVFKFELKRTLKYLEQLSLNTENALEKAKDYMLLYKQYQDIGYNIELMEKYVFSTDIMARLRLPLLAYTRCQDNLKSRTYSPNVDKN